MRDTKKLDSAEDDFLRSSITKTIEQLKDIKDVGNSFSFPLLS